MYLCPKCHNEISKTARVCPYCNFNFKISLGRYQIREQKLQEDVKNRKIIYNKKVIESKLRKLPKIDEYLERESFKKALDNLNISSKQAEVLRYKIISKIFSNQFKTKSKELPHNIKNFYFGYENELNANPPILLKNLEYLLKITGFNDFSSYYKKLLSKNKIPTSSGVKILGFLMYDVLDYKIKKDEIDAKIIEYVSKEKYRRKKFIKKNLNQYYKETGKYYFSKRFDSIIEIYGLTVKKAFEIKERVLVSIYFTNSRVPIRQRLDDAIIKISKQKKPQANMPKKRKLGSKTSQYAHKRNNEYGILGDYYK